MMRFILFLFLAAFSTLAIAQTMQQPDPQININPQVNTTNQNNNPHGGLGNEDINMNDEQQVQQLITYNEVVQQAGTVQINANVNWASSNLSASATGSGSSSYTATKHKHRSVHKKKHGVVFTKMFSKKFRAVNHYSGKSRFRMCHEF